MGFSNSSLVSYTKLSPNHSGTRNHKIDTISIHCMAGNFSVEACGRGFSNPNVPASANYGIGSDGRIALYVEEKNRSWCTSSASNDNRAITIEVANDGGANTGWHVSEQAFNSLIDLLVDVCQRNNIKELKWQADKKLIGQVDKQNMTVHRWFANKACPGDYLYNKHYEIAQLVNERLNIQEDDEMTQEQFNIMFNNAMNEYRKSLQDNDSGNWSKEAREWATAIGLIKGGDPLPDGSPNYMWQDMLTREQMATLLYRFKDMIK